MCPKKKPSLHLIKKSQNAKGIVDIVRLACHKSRAKIHFMFTFINFPKFSIAWNLCYRSIVHKVSRKTSATITSGKGSMHSWLLIWQYRWQRFVAIVIEKPIFICDFFRAALPRCRLPLSSNWRALFEPTRARQSRRSQKANWDGWFLLHLF